MSSMKIQSTMKIRAAVAALCVVFAASRALRGDVVQTMESVTDLVKSLNQEMHAGRAVEVVRKNTAEQEGIPAEGLAELWDRKPEYVQEGHESTKKQLETNASQVAPRRTLKLKSAVNASSMTLHNSSHPETLTQTNASKAAAGVTGLRNKGMACDAEMCRVQQQARCEAKCDLEREAKRRVQGNGTTMGRTTDHSGSGATSKGSLLAEGDVCHSWSGMYESHLGYVNDCFGYSTAMSSELSNRHAKITSSGGSTKTFEVKFGQERMGICYAIYYIGTLEDKSQSTCSSYQHLRQSMCPECCEPTESMTGCSGGCSP